MHADTREDKKRKWTGGDGSNGDGQPIGSDALDTGTSASSPPRNKKQKPNKLIDFWAHRWSNDIVYMAQVEPDQFLKNFGEFFANLPKTIDLYAGNQKSVPTEVTPDWTKLISVEVQTNKWRRGKTNTLHAKFYFEKSYAKTSITGFEFNNKNYEGNLNDIADYWDDEEISSDIASVFSDNNSKYKVFVVDNFAGFNMPQGLSLPQNKDIYLIKKDYAEELRKRKEEIRKQKEEIRKRRDKKQFRGKQFR